MKPSGGHTIRLTVSDRRKLLRRVGTGGLSLGGMPLSAQAVLALELASAGYRVVWVTDGVATLDVAWKDLQVLSRDFGIEPVRLPEWENWPEDVAVEDRGARHAALHRILQGARLVVSSVPALMQKVPPPHFLREGVIRLRRGLSCDPDRLIRELESRGYEVVPQVSGRMEAARRGGILDLWPAEADTPLRLEFFGDGVESVRTFDPVTQRSVERLPETVILPLADWDTLRREGTDLTAFLEGRVVVLRTDPENLRSAAELYEEAAVEARSMEYIHPLDLLDERFRAVGAAVVEVGEGARYGGRGGDEFLSLGRVEGVPALDRSYLEPDAAEKARTALLEEAARHMRAGWRVVFFFDTGGSLRRFRESRGDWLEQTAADGPGSIACRIGVVSGGFVYGSGRLMVVAESDLYGTPKDRILRMPRRRPPAVGIASPDIWREFQPGDLVVHVDHGIGKYLGLYEIEIHGRQQEVLAVEYAGGSRLFVPVNQAHLLSRYIGVGRTRPELHSLYSRRWQRQKSAAQHAVRDLASEMLQVQAVRQTRRGHAFSEDTVWQREFEAAFPYVETEDQARAVEEVKRDMESPRPMDRLICGDVGYGKTEVAMRAAFKAVMDGKQVAVLVPTTVLAQQHYDTFRQRMAAYPVVIEMLSRFRSPAEQKRIIEALAAGRIDIVIGTHRLLQPDVRFHDLGLVVIDEEQRFGVEHKERLKKMRALVDVLTLSATPIPRTLYLSLTGVRDMSVIETPPQDRLPVETIVTEYDDSVVRRAILRELNREGQVYYLHNRVATIERVARRLRELVPEARIVVAHGRMDEKELADVMHRFVARQADVLVCTTIIESGVDIPNVNTILIDRADRFGMADLYQLRGRVGRYRHQAYAYLLLPRHGRLFHTARRRIRTLQRHTALGAGLKLAMRDLEIRGAGNLLGREQSGHIAAIGFELYCQLLRREVARLKGERIPPLVSVQIMLDFVDVSPRAGERAAAIPHEYVEDERLRLEMYRRLASAVSAAEIQELRQEWRDRFGPLPPAVENLLTLAEVRIAAAERRIDRIQVRDERVIMRRGEEVIKPGRRFPRLPPGPVEVRLRGLLEIIAGCPVPEQNLSVMHRTR